LHSLILREYGNEQYKSFLRDIEVFLEKSST